MTDLKQHKVIDEIEFEEIILSQTNPLLKYCYGLLCNHADAEDAVQITFIKLYRNRDNIDPDKSLNTYLYKIAYSTSIDILRKKKKITLLGEAKDEEAYTEKGYDYAFPEELKVALLALDPIDRGLVVNRVIHEMRYKELSDLYGKSEAYLRKRYERTRNRLSNQISDDFSGLAKKGVYDER